MISSGTASRFASSRANSTATPPCSPFGPSVVRSWFWTLMPARSLPVGASSAFAAGEAEAVVMSSADREVVEEMARSNAMQIRRSRAAVSRFLITLLEPPMHRVLVLALRTVRTTTGAEVHLARIAGFELAGKRFDDPVHTHRVAVHPLPHRGEECRLVIRVLVYPQLLRRLDPIVELIDEFDGTPRVVFTGRQQRRSRDAFLFTFDGHAAHDLVELLLALRTSEVAEELLVARRERVEDVVLVEIRCPDADVRLDDRVAHRRDGETPVRSHRLRVDGDLVWVHLFAALQPFRDRDHRTLVIVGGELRTAQVARALARPVHGQEMHAAIECMVYLRVRIDLLRHVAAGNVDDRRRFRAALEHVEIALQLGALEGNLDALDRIGRELDHLRIVGEAASVQVTLLVIRFEHRVLRGGELSRGAIVELERRHPVTGRLLFRGDAFHALGDAPDMLRDLRMAFHARRKIAAVGVPMKDAAGFLDEVIEDPLLSVPVETGCTHRCSSLGVFESNRRESHALARTAFSVA